MADDDTERSEDPTQKKLDDALGRGDVPRSQEVNTWFVIAGGTLLLLGFSGQMSAGLQTSLRGLIANSYDIPVDGRGLIRLSSQLGTEVLAAVAIPFLLLALAAIAANLVQHRFVWSAEGLKPKLSKISLISGFGRLFSKEAVVNLVKGLIKMGLLGIVLVTLMWPERHRLDTMVSTDPAAILPLTRTLALSMMGTVVAILALMAAADYLFQYRQWFEKQKMSLQEIKDEFKQSEGDPMVKGRLRQLRMEKARKRMMAAVPKASVIITNPTHFAVALKYDRGMNAPVCLAKGVDRIALKIREIAQEHNIPIVENPPLARALHATVDLDKEIPVEHYKAVAEVIGYVMRLRRAVSR